MVRGCTKIPRGECHRHKTGFGKETRFGISVIFGLFGMDAGWCADERWQFCACAVVFPTKLIEQTIMTSLNDVMGFSHAREGGKYKKESVTKLEDFGCCYYCRLGVSTQVLVSTLSHRPSSSAVLVPLQ